MIHGIKAQNGDPGIQLYSVNGKSYMTLPAALKVAQAPEEDSRIALLGNAGTKTENIVIPAGVTLDVGSHRLTAASLSVEGTLEVAPEGSIAVDDYYSVEPTAEWKPGTFPDQATGTATAEVAQNGITLSKNNNNNDLNAHSGLTIGTSSSNGWPCQIRGLTTLDHTIVIGFRNVSSTQTGTLFAEDVDTGAPPAYSSINIVNGAWKLGWGSNYEWADLDIQQPDDNIVHFFTFSHSRTTGTVVFFDSNPGREYADLKSIEENLTNGEINLGAIRGPGRVLSLCNICYIAVYNGSKLTGNQATAAYRRAKAAVNDVYFETPSSDWTDYALPVVANTFIKGSGAVSFANSSRFSQMINGRKSVVANVLGGAYDEINGFLKQNEQTTDYNQDVYLMMRSGSANRVKGFMEAHWGVSDVNMIRPVGNALVQLDGNAQVGFVFGAGDKGGYKSGANNASGWAKVTGNTGVVVKGNAVVTGAIIGGWSSSHTANATVDGNTSILVKNIQAVNSGSLGEGHYVPNNFVIGGSVYSANNGASAATITGNSKVTIRLDNAASGTFVKNIISGSLLPDNVLGDNANQIFKVHGNSSVAITAPNGVVFSGIVVGGGYSGRGAGNGVGSAPVAGSASVVIKGGKYTGRIVAGGYAPNNGKAMVSGSATLRLDGGVFNGATISPGQASGIKSLVIGGEVDLSNATVESFSLKIVHTTGALTMNAGQEGNMTVNGVLKLILSAEQIESGYAASRVVGPGSIVFLDSNGTILQEKKISDGGAIYAH